MAGLGFASEPTSSRVIVVERESAPGGCLRTDRPADGYLVDRTGHLFHFKHPRVRRLLDERLGMEWNRLERDARVAVAGKLVGYPLQYHLGELPPELAYECLAGFVEAQATAGDPGGHFEGWARATLGKGLYDVFMGPYNRKLWACELDGITLEWTDRFVPPPDRELVLRGAVGAHERKDFGYNPTFDYPHRGGSQTIADRLADGSGAIFLYGESVARIDAAGRRAETSSGRTIRYRQLVNTMPLTVLVGEVLAQPPAELTAAARQLRHNSIAYAVFAVKMPAPPWQWLYVPDERLPFYRVGQLSAYADDLAPPGEVLLCAEVGMPMEEAAGADPQALVEACWDGLRQLGVVAEDAGFEMVKTGAISPAYCIFDDQRPASRKALLEGLAALGIHSIGRYGEWEYGSAGDALLAGMELADRLKEA